MHDRIHQQNQTDQADRIKVGNDQFARLEASRSPTRETHSNKPSNLPEFTQGELFRLTSGLIGLQFCWAVQVGYVTKSLLELGLSQQFVSYAWLAGPIAGIVVQPTVGVLSDRCTSRLGRRRPYLIGGTILSAVCLLFFAFAEEIGESLGDEPNTTPKRYALCTSIIAFWALDFSINAAQGPLRALLADIVPPAQHQQGNAFFALATGLGNCAGSLLGSLRLATLFPSLGFRNDLQALFSASVVFLLVFMGCTVISVKEKPLLSIPSSLLTPIPLADDITSRENITSDTEYESTLSNNSVNEVLPLSVSSSSNSLPIQESRTWFPFLNLSFLRIALEAPPPFWSTFCIQCFSWFGWFTLFVFGTSWVGSDVMHGSFSAAEGSDSRAIYDAGVRLGNLGLGLQSVVTILVSPLLPLLLRIFNTQTIYISASVTLAVALGSSLVLHQAWQSWIAVLAIASTGFAWAVTMTVPWSLMGEAVVKLDPARAGIYYTLFNLSQCFPEVAVSVVAEEIERITGKQSAVLMFGAISVLCAAILIIALKVGADPSNFDGKMDPKLVDMEVTDGVKRSIDEEAELRVSLTE